MAFINDPPVCEITYECITVVSLNETESAISCDDQNVVVYFSTLTGRLILRTYDMAKYSPGVYQFTIRGTSGTVALISTEVVFTMTLVDPCPTTSLSNIQVRPFIDMRYILG